MYYYPIKIVHSIVRVGPFQLSTERASKDTNYISRQRDFVPQNGPEPRIFFCTKFPEVRFLPLRTDLESLIRVEKRAFTLSLFLSALEIARSFSDTLLK